MTRGRKESSRRRLLLLSALLRYQSSSVLSCSPSSLYRPPIRPLSFSLPFSPTSASLLSLGFNMLLSSRHALPTLRAATRSRPLSAGVVRSMHIENKVNNNFPL